VPEGATLRVEGYRELVRSFALLERKEKREVREILRRSGEKVRLEAGQKVLADKPQDTKTASGYRTRVRQRGVAVEQALRKTTGVHPEWGGWQMRHALEPALQDNETFTRLAMERAMDELAAWFNAKGQLH
jgi:hypothetical protein